uniref:Variant surface glycoprotein 1176 n=1 Tax=Trypanosoma brucei TaxID=5691 RepID=M4SVQ2_9TRYP|nr:variant surface glycoprotein 1176 [Trypanosoma brucei]
MYAIIRMTLVLWLVEPAESGDIPGAANRAEHAALCKFITMASREVEVPEIPALPTDEYDYIHMANFSTAPESWQNMFFEDKTTKKAHGDPKAAGAAQRGFETNWGQWKKTALSHLDATTTDAKKKLGIVQLNANEGKLAKPQLAHLAALADELVAELSGLQPGPNSPTATTASQALAQAAYGQDSVPSADPTPAKVFGAALARDRDVACAAKNEPAQVATALAALACVCHKGNANAVDPAVCTEQAKGSGNWQNSDPPATALTGSNLAAIAKSCTKDSKQKVTAAEVEGAISTLNQLIHKGPTDSYLRSFVSTKCSGSSGEGVCIKFANYDSKQNPLVNELTWIPPLKALLSQLDSLEAQKQRAKQLVERIKSLKKQTTVVIEVAKATASSMAKFETKTNHQKPTSETTSSCSAHTTNATCTAKNCKWEEKTDIEGKFIVDKSEVKILKNTAGTGDGAAGITKE